MNQQRWRRVEADTRDRYALSGEVRGEAWTLWQDEHGWWAQRANSEPVYAGAELKDAQSVAEGRVAAAALGYRLAGLLARKLSLSVLAKPLMYSPGKPLYLVVRRGNGSEVRRALAMLPLRNEVKEQ